MSKNSKICPNCGRKMKQQFIGLQHCKCGISWKRDMGYFERTNEMVFALQRVKIGKKVKQTPVIRWTIVNKVDRKIKKAIQIGLETKGY